jgi:hypothetical protein
VLVRGGDILMAEVIVKDPSIKKAVMFFAILFEKAFSEMLRVGCPAWVVDETRTYCSWKSVETRHFGMSDKSRDVRLTI